MIFSAYLLLLPSGMKYKTPRIKYYCKGEEKATFERGILTKHQMMFTFHWRLAIIISTMGGEGK